MLRRVLPSLLSLPPSDRVALVVSAALLPLVIAFFSWFADHAVLVSVLRFLGLPLLLFVLGTVTVTVGASLVDWYRHLGWSGWVSWLGRHRMLFLVFAGLTILVISLFPPGGRIQYDETSILLTSKAIHEERETITPSGSMAVGHVLKLRGAFIDKRPFFFATVVSFLHDLRGYSPRNPFYANMLLASATLALVGLWARRLGGSDRSAALAMLALASVPLFCEYATGGGIDIANLFALAFLGVAATVHLDQPSERSARILVGAALVLAYARYESLMFALLPVAVVVLVYSRHRRLFFDWTIPAMLASLFPLACIHFSTLLAPAENFQFSDKGVTSAFSLSFLGRNLEHAARFFLNTEHQLTNSLPVLFLGGSAWLLAAVSWRRRRKMEADPNASLVFWWFSGLVLLGFGLLMCYSWGELDQPVGSRLCLPLYLLLSLSLPVALREVPNVRWLPHLVAGGLLWGVYWQAMPVATKGMNTLNYSAVMKLRAFDAFLEAQPDRRIVVLNSLTNFWATRDVFAIAPADIDSNPDFLKNLLASGFYRAVYLIQESERPGAKGTAPFALVQRDAYRCNLELESIEVHNLCDLSKVAIYQVRSVGSATNDGRSSPASEVPAPYSTASVPSSVFGPRRTVASEAGDARISVAVPAP